MEAIVDIERKEELTKELQNILNQLIRLYHPKKVILFGSLVEGNIDDSSDIDLFVVKDDVPKRRHDRTYELDKLISRTKATDFLVYTSEEVQSRLSKGDLFVKDILENGKVLYEQAI